MKGDDVRERCREDYGVLGLQLREIAKRRTVSERTLYNWRKADAGGENDWDVLRDKLVHADSALSKELMQLATVTARRIRQVLEDGGMPDNGQVLTLQRLLNSCNAARRNEKDPAPETEAKEVLSPDQVRSKTFEVVQKAMGIV